MKGSLVIAERELPAILRSRQTVWILLAVASIFAATVLLKWPESGVASLSGDQAKATFRSLALSMLAAVVLIIPAFPATGIVVEVRRRTMELLLNSPLRRFEIFTGKAIALLGFVLILLTVTLPAMACCYAMGGISFTNDVLVLYGFIVIVCLQLIVLGVLVGTFAGSPESALRCAYGCTFALVVVTLIPWQFLQGFEGWMGNYAGLLRKLSPITALLELLNDSGLETVGLSTQENLFAAYLWSAAIFVVVGSIVCISRLNYSLLDRSRSQGVITDDRTAAARSVRRVFFLIDPQRRKAGIPGFLNPVLAKEFRSRQFGRLHWLLRLIAGCAVMSLLLTLATTMGTVDWGVERIGGIIIVAQVALIVVLTPGMAGGMIAGEMESGGWNLLRVTPLSASKILRGKLMSVMLTLMLVLCASLPGYAIMMAIKPDLQQQVIQVLVCLVLSAVLSLLLSATVSSFFKTTAAATTVSYGLLITLFAGTLIVWANMNAPFGHYFVEQVLSLNPMAGALNAIRAEGFESFNLVPRTWWISGSACVVLLVVLQLRIRHLCQPD
ncbi:MAG: ABC transporter permease subunit [Fuerstiella sp.]